MTVIVTGASGFLGNKLVESLNKDGIDVIGVARTLIDLPYYIKVKNYNETPEGDILVHMAECSDRNLVNRLGVSYLEQMENNLGELLDKGFNKVLYISSAAVYGDETNKIHSCIEKLEPTDTYTYNKLRSEAKVLEKNGIVARFSNIYGPGMSEKNVISKILGQISSSGSIKIWDSTPVRDFLYISDAISILQAMISNDKRGIYNVGSGDEKSIREVIQYLLLAVNQSSRKIEDTNPNNQPSCIRLDTSSTNADFNWLPKVTLVDGIKQLVNNLSIE